MIKRIAFIVSFCCLCLLKSKAQYNNDFRTRTGIEITKDLRKGFQLGLQYQVRSVNNASQFQGSYFTLSTGYKINNIFSTQLDVRYATSPIWDRFRFAYYLNAQYKLNKFKYSCRVGYLHEVYKQEFNEIGQFLPTYNFRLRARAERKVFKKTKAQIGVEPVIALNNSKLNFRQIRNIMGLQWEFAKNNELSIEYMWQPFFMQSYLYSNHSIVLNYTINIPEFNKKKEQ